ncbi:MAG TPA: hypothetical protein VGE29_04540 [Prosthecobacter sp.]
MYFDDLSHDSYLGECRYVRSIAWLGTGHRFTIGAPPADLVPLLNQHLRNPWSVFAAAGTHNCEFCEAEGRVHRDARNLFIPSPDTVYFAPGMIVHYIEQHGYLPPQAFIEAVRLCPPQGSDKFMLWMKDFGAWWDAQIGTVETRQA